jgi:hypothetical protein
MPIHLPIIILTSLHLTPIADTAPEFDIARQLCRIADVPRNGEGCEESAEVTFAAVDH